MMTTTSLTRDQRNRLVDMLTSRMGPEELVFVHGLIHRADGTDCDRLHFHADDPCSFRGTACPAHLMIAVHHCELTVYPNARLPLVGGTCFVATCGTGEVLLQLFPPNGHVNREDGTTWATAFPEGLLAEAPEPIAAPARVRSARKATSAA